MKASVIEFFCGHDLFHSLARMGLVTAGTTKFT
jgi:hypothetical protein